MKVNSANVNSHLNVNESKGEKAKDSSKTESVEGSGSELSASAKVDFSQQAKNINELKELATPDMDSVREDKVAALQKLIDEGSYNIDAASIADRLVDEHLIM